MNLLLNTNSFCSDEDFTDIRIAFFDCKWQCKRIRQFDVRQSRFDWIVDADKFRASNGPFFGETSRILPGWTVTANGIPVTTVTYSPWPTGVAVRTVNVWSDRPENTSELLFW